MFDLALPERIRWHVSETKLPPNLEWGYNAYMELAPDKLFTDWKKTPNQYNLAQVVKSFDPIVESSIASHKGQVNHTLMRSKARLLVADAVKSYDPKMGTNISTHIYNYLKPLNRTAKSMVEVAPLSRHQDEEAARYVRAVSDYNEEYGREPDDAELQDILGVGRKQLARLHSSIKYEIPEGQIVGDFSNDSPDDDPESGRLNLWTEYVYHDLDHVGRKILDMKLGRNGHPQMSNDDIAVRMKMSPVEVSNRSSQIAQKILDGIKTRERVIL